MTAAAADVPHEDYIVAIFDPNGVFRPSYDHAISGSEAERGAWCTWAFGNVGRHLIRRGRDRDAEAFVDRIDALPLPADGPTGAVARFAGRETMRLRLALRQPSEQHAGEPEHAGGAA